MGGFKASFVRSVLINKIPQRHHESSPSSSTRLWYPVWNKCHRILQLHHEPPPAPFARAQSSPDKKVYHQYLFHRCSLTQSNNRNRRYERRPKWKEVGFVDIVHPEQDWRLFDGFHVGDQPFISCLFFLGIRRALSRISPLFMVTGGCLLLDPRNMRTKPQRTISSAFTLLFLSSTSSSTRCPDLCQPGLSPAGMVLLAGALWRLDSTLGRRIPQTVSFMEM